MIHNGTLYWQNCSMCGARWIGTHTCDPTPQPTVRNITLPPMSKLVIGSVQAENARLRAALAKLSLILKERRVGHSVMCLHEPVGSPCICGYVEAMLLCSEPHSA